MADPEKQPVIEDVDDDDSQDCRITELMSNPQALQAIQDQLNGRGLMVNLHPVVKRRIKALKKLQKKCLDIESKFYEEVHALECKYASQYDPLYEKRKDIIIGTIEPIDSDCEWA